MTPKAQQVGTYEVPSDRQSDFKEKHQKNSSSGSNVLANINTSSSTNTSLSNSTSMMILNNLSNRVTSVIHPAVIFFVATPIAMRYPLIQFIMFLTILVGSSPLYFIMITFVGKSNKLNNSHYSKQSQNQPHRRQPSIVGSIAELTDDYKDGNTTVNKKSR